MAFDLKETEGLGSQFFYSSRTERHSVAGGEIQIKKGYFARNPAMKIIVIDLLLIALIAVVIVPFILKQEGTGELFGYSLKLKAFNYGDQVMVLLTLKGQGEGGQLVEGQFYFEEGENQIILSDLLPTSGMRTLRGSLDSLSKETVYCRVVIGEEEKTLKTSIR